MLRFYNTKSRKIEDFKPIEDDIVRIYSCGPTVYSYQHLGNMRAAIFTDVLKNILRYHKFKLIDVVNITDVGHLVSDEDEGEDKMLKAAKKENKDPYEIARYYEQAYVRDLKDLNVTLPKYMPRATDHIKEQLEMIEKLEKNSYTYVTTDGVYYDTSKFKDYGKLSGQKLEDKKAGARVETKSEKKNPADFALWKFLTGENKNHIMKWDSKWGSGFPGWHIECSAMGHKYLGDKIDIHTGGIEHIPVHHENEIAQNEGSKQIRKVNFWIHNEHMMVDSTKMSKSLGNVYTLQDIKDKGFHPLSFRELCLRAHYRKQMNFTLEALKSAEAGFKKINDFYSRFSNLNPSDSKSFAKEITKKHLKEFEEAIDDDLNTSVALSAVYEFMNEVNRHEKFSKEDISEVLGFMEKTDRILKLIEKGDIPEEIRNLAKHRVKAREDKDWALSDKLRDEIRQKGYEIRDDKNSKDGFIIDKL